MSGKATTQPTLTERLNHARLHLNEPGDVCPYCRAEAAEARLASAMDVIETARTLANLEPYTCAQAALDACLDALARWDAALGTLPRDHPVNKCSPRIASTTPMGSTRGDADAQREKEKGGP